MRHGLVHGLAGSGILITRASLHEYLFREFLRTVRRHVVHGGLVADRVCQISVSAPVTVGSLGARRLRRAVLLRRLRAEPLLFSHLLWWHGQVWLAHRHILRVATFKVKRLRQLLSPDGIIVLISDLAYLCEQLLLLVRFHAAK